MGRVPDRTRGIEVDGSAGRTTIENTTVTLDGGVVRPIDINQPGREGARVRTQGSVPPTPRVTLKGVTVTGHAPGPGGAIDIVGRPGCTLRDCRVEVSGRGEAISLRGTNRYLLSESEVRLTGTGTGTGVSIQNSAGGRIDSTSIVAPEYPLVVVNDGSSDACPVRITGKSAFQSSMERPDGDAVFDHEFVALGDGGCLDLAARRRAVTGFRVVSIGNDSAELIPVGTK
jgi:hypothetical protein